MHADTQGGLKIYFFNNLSKHPGIRHFVSTRLGGVSKPPFDSLNLSFIETDMDSVLENHKRLSEVVKIPMENFVFCKQVHSGNVALITDQQKGAGVFSRETAISNTDALITVEPNLCLTVFAADCVPILLFDPMKKALAAVHSGWKGTVAKILTNAIERMQGEYGTDPQYLIAGIGPSIGPESYEVDTPVIQAFKAAFPKEDFVVMKDETHGMLDLWKANKYQLLQKGVLEENIEIARIDTFQNAKEFFSDRRQRPTGRFAASIMFYPSAL